MLKIFKRDLFLCAAITAAVILCALVCGSPFVGTTAQVHAQSAQGHSSAFQGEILSNGEQILLRDNSGTVYTIDNPRIAAPFVGKAVTVSARLEPTSKTIHIERIEPAA